VGEEGSMGVVGEGDLLRVLPVVTAKALVVMAVVVVVMVVVMVEGVHQAVVVVVVMVVGEVLVTVTTVGRVTITSTRPPVATAETPLARAQGVIGVAEVTPLLHHYDTSVTPLWHHCNTTFTQTEIAMHVLNFFENNFSHLLKVCNIGINIWVENNAYSNYHIRSEQREADQE
jgi:hypothetical protein